MGQVFAVGWSQEKTGFGYLRIKSTNLMDVLVDASEKADIPIHYGKTLVGIEEDEGKVTARFSDSTYDTADFLIGCDGIHSAIQKLYVDPDTAPEYSGVSNIFSLIPSQGLPRAALDIDGDLHATITADGVLALSPCTVSSNTIYWFFSRENPIPKSGNTRDGWEEYGKKGVKGRKSTLLNILGDTQGK